MTATPENLRQIRDAFAANPAIDWDLDWDDPEQVADLIYGDSNGNGEGVEYRRGTTEGDLGFRQTWGRWVLAESTTTGEYGADGRLVWHHTWTVYPDRASAKAGYIARIHELQAEGVTWEPDVCPIWDRIARTWQ